MSVSQIRNCLASRIRCEHAERKTEVKGTNSFLRVILPMAAAMEYGLDKKLLYRDCGGCISLQRKLYLVYSRMELLRTSEEEEIALL